MLGGEKTFCILRTENILFETTERDVHAVNAAEKSTCSVIAEHESPVMIILVCL